MIKKFEDNVQLVGRGIVIKANRAISIPPFSKKKKEKKNLSVDNDTKKSCRHCCK